MSCSFILLSLVITHTNTIISWESFWAFSSHLSRQWWTGKRPCLHPWGVAGHHSALCLDGCCHVRWNYTVISSVYSPSSLLILTLSLSFSLLFSLKCFVFSFCIILNHICAFVCCGVCMYVFMCMCCVCVREGRIVGVFLSLSTLWTVLFPLAQRWDDRTLLPHPVFTWVLGIQTQVFMLVQQVLYQLSHCCEQMSSHSR